MSIKANKQMDENKTLAEMIAVRKKATPRPRKLKETTVEDDAKLAPILAGKLGTANYSLSKAKTSLYKSNDTQIETYGRLYKYEGKPIIEETLAYAEENGLFIQCDSKFIGLKTKISPVVKGKKEFLAHLTHYNKFLKKAQDGDVPESYNGNFLYKSFKPQFDALLKKNPKSFTCLEDLFNLSEGSPI